MVRSKDGDRDVVHRLSIPRRTFVRCGGAIGSSRFDERTARCPSIGKDEREARQGLQAADRCGIPPLPRLCRATRPLAWPSLTARQCLELLEILQLAIRLDVNHPCHYAQIEGKHDEPDTLVIQLRQTYCSPLVLQAILTANVEGRVIH